MRKLRVACAIAIDVRKSFFSSSDLSGSSLWESLFQEAEVYRYLVHLRKTEFVENDRLLTKLH